MSLHTHPIKEENHDLYFKIRTWAELNFYLQSTLIKGKESFIHGLDKKLQEVGYQGKSVHTLDDIEFKKLFEKESFFSYSATGKRIAAFALKENGLNKDTFQEIEDSITLAYNEIKKVYSQNILLEQSYLHSIDTIGVFKP